MAKKRTDNDERQTLRDIQLNTQEGDEAPSGALRLRDVLGGDFLWTMVRGNVWVILLIVLITTAYVAVRYQCQQDAIDISQLEKDLVDAKFESLSSSSNLTRMCRQSNVLQLLGAQDSTLLQQQTQPPFIIEIPQK